MKNYRFFVALSAILLFFSLFSGVLASDQEREVYRLYSPVTGEHLYTMDDNEKSSLVGIGWRDEGVAFWAYPKLEWDWAQDHIPVFRLNNDRLRLHLYTSDPTEIATLQQQGWTVDGNGDGCFYYAPDDTTPVYRLYNPSNGHHLLTVDPNEYNSLPAAGWKQEGPKFMCCFWK